MAAVPRNDVLRGLAEIRSRPGLLTVQQWLNKPDRSSVYPLFVKMVNVAPTPLPRGWASTVINQLQAVKWLLRSTEGPFIEVVYDYLPGLGGPNVMCVARLVFRSVEQRDASLREANTHYARQALLRWRLDTPERPALPYLAEGERRPLPTAPRR